MRITLFQPYCCEYLYPVYEGDKIVAVEGAGDLYDFVEEYYESI